MIVFHSENGENQNQNQMNDAFELIEALGKRIIFFNLEMLQDFRKNPEKTLFTPFLSWRIFQFRIPRVTCSV